MKIATKIAGFLMSWMTLCASVLPVSTMAQNTEMARPRSTVDLSRTDRLTGAPTPQDNPSYCPSGQVLSGGVCVLISNHDVDGPQGTFCGAANESVDPNGPGTSPIFNANHQQLDTILCKGFNPLYGCPSGYEKAFQYFGGFSNYMATCVKQ